MLSTRRVRWPSERFTRSTREAVELYEGQVSLSDVLSYDELSYVGAEATHLGKVLCTQRVEASIHQRHIRVDVAAQQPLS